MRHHTGCTPSESTVTRIRWRYLDDPESPEGVRILTSKEARRVIASGTCPSL